MFEANASAKWPRWRYHPSLLLACCLQGCVVLPTTTTVYDPDCRIAAKHMQLEAVQLATLMHCSGSECAAILVAVGATAVASAVVSGSIVIVGNVVYWFEKQSDCKRAN